MDKRKVLEKLAFDPSKVPNREKVAFIKKGMYIDTYTDDPDPYIRFEVANHGHSLGILVHDSNQYVSNIARWVLMTNG